MPANQSALPYRKLLAGGMMIGAVGVSLVSLLARLGGWIWPLDLLSHFRLQYAIIMLVLLVGAAASRSAVVTSIVGLLFVLHLIPLAPLVLASGQPQGNGTELRMVQFNVLTSNTRVEHAAQWLIEQDPDVIVAQETNQRWAKGLTEQLNGWTAVTEQTIQEDNFGMLVFVRDGLDIGRVDVVDTYIPAVAVEIGPALLYAVHTLPPVGPDNSEIAQEQLDLAASVLNAHDGHRILIGDLNSTRWGAAYRSILANSDLRDSADGNGLGGTWPAGLWFTGMIGIDHVLVSSDVRVDSRAVGPNLGSDHRPVVVDLTLIDG